MRDTPAILNRNRFRNSSGKSIIAINQWVDSIGGTKLTGAASEVGIYNSVFSDDTSTGPLIDLAQGQQFRFINNTVANSTTGNTTFSSVVAVGFYHGSATNQGFISDHQFEFHDNLFYNVVVGRSLLNNAYEPSLGILMNCDAVGSNSGTQDGARNNWFIYQDAFTNSMDQGDCGLATGTTGSPAHSNIFTITTVGPVFESANFFTAGNNPQNPYRLFPGAVHGIDEGEDGFTSLIGVTDLRGAARTVEKPSVGASTIDIGSYELGP